MITRTLAQSQESKHITMPSTLSRNTFNESLSDEDQSVEEALTAYHGESEAQEADIVGWRKLLIVTN
jgi:hypothetical protein